MNPRIVFCDTEVAIKTKHIMDIGAVDSNGAVFHNARIREFLSFLNGAGYICGHNIIHHDLEILNKTLMHEIMIPAIDTLYLSPLLFPKKPYHALLKDDKIVVDELNNPVNDSEKSRSLFYDEVAAFNRLSYPLKSIYFSLLRMRTEFRGFFQYVGFSSIPFNLEQTIKKEFEGMICANANLQIWIERNPLELAYALALISANDETSVTPRWLQVNFPEIENVMRSLRGTPCKGRCPYCAEKLDIYRALRIFFGYNEYRKYNSEPLQERAVQAAVNGDSLLAIFPTGGGKSITFQIPALIAGETVHGLTVIISPLQSLMKDQVDNLTGQGIVNAVTVNGLLSPIERKDAYERIENGSANLLYISPEMLRSNTIERILLSRNIVRFVIDEAHCFSSWGQDFRVDYLYIGDFIRMLQERKHLNKPIPVSCFTATAKQKVVTDICEYFDCKLGLKLNLFTTNAARENLHYTVLYKDTDDDKYATLRGLIEAKNCPTIVYVTRTKRAEEIAEKLERDGFAAKPFHGKMEPGEKIANQESFIKNETRIIVATSAFGMGVDKKDVRLVIHYNISDSLENYVQEAGRAGRDPGIQAECYVLFSNSDLDAHFMLLNQTKLSIGEIQQVWRAIKDLTRTRSKLCCSPLEIARQAGWDDSVKDIETRVKTAVAALENAGYIVRGKNIPHVYATSIRARNMREATNQIMAIEGMTDLEKDKARTLVSAMISSRTIGNNLNDEAESRVDYLADRNGLEKAEVIEIVNKLRQSNVLSDEQDMSAFIPKVDPVKHGLNILEKFKKLEQYVIHYIIESGTEVNLKEMNEAAQDEKITGASVKNIRTVLYYLTIKNYIKQHENKEKNTVQIEMLYEPEQLERRYRRRIKLCDYIVHYLASKIQEAAVTEQDDVKVDFSLVGIQRAYLEEPQLYLDGDVTLNDVEDSLLYLSKINALKLEGGFLVLYSAIQIERKELDNKIRYKLEDYRMLDEFYKQRIQQIHIVGEYANLMVNNYNVALAFVHDYFGMDFKKFIAKYFKGERETQINRNITPKRYEQLFGTLSAKQTEVIGDTESKYIVVGAGPGSGKTKLLVHKLASLLLMEDIKHEQLLMLTFSRAAATEFKHRLINLIHGAAHFVEIKTFHSYCFDLLGKIGNLEDSENVVRDAATLISDGEVERGKITKSVLVIDEAQDMDRDEFSLVRALMSANDDMRVIAVGDDDQNIYEFRGSSSEYMALLVKEHGAKYYEMVENFRSKRRIVDFANKFVNCINRRMKKMDITANSESDGEVNMVYHQSEAFEQSVVDSILALKNRKSICVLTNTNDEALRIAGLLNYKGVRAKLIQTNDGFKLSDLYEIRTFLWTIKKLNDTPVIPCEVWTEAKRQLIEKFRTSSCLSNCLNLVRQFEQVNTRQKYMTDLLEFIDESGYDDFYESNDDVVFVSTIHKSKGHEFDNVYLYFNNVSLQTDEDKRKIYVGMTRAKCSLNVYHNMKFFIAFAGYHSSLNNYVYARPGEITIQLTHRDVVLDFFKGKQRLIANYRSGQEIEFDGIYFHDGDKRLVKISQKMAAEINRLEEKGYRPTVGFARFIVAWKSEEDENECAVMLPNLIFRL